MRKKVFIIIIMLIIIIITGCQLNNTKKMVCKMNGESNIQVEIVVGLNSNNKVSKIEIHSIFESKEEAQKEFNNFKSIHGDNAILNKNVIIVKNVQDYNTYFGKKYSKTVGYTKEEFQSFLGNYTCK